MRGAILAILAITLLGCGHRPPKIVTQEVKVEVPVRCVDPADIPGERELAHKSLQKGDTIFQKVRALLIDVKGLQSDNGELRALLTGCIKSEP